MIVAFREVSKVTLEGINAIAISGASTDESAFIVSGSIDKSLKVWNLKEKTLVHHFVNAHTSN
jgi:hypothetical protein